MIITSYCYSGQDVELNTVFTFESCLESLPSVPQLFNLHYYYVPVGKPELSPHNEMVWNLTFGASSIHFNYPLMSCNLMFIWMLNYLVSFC